MIFSSVTFLFYFLPIIILLYSVTPPRYKNAVLFLASLFFYAWGEPKYVFLMLFSTIVDYFLGNCMGRYRNKAKFFMIGSVVINLSLLFFFKYSNLLLTTYNHIFTSNLSLLDITLPIGISFYTFQTMSYSIDVYREKVKPQKNFIDFAAYVTLFPQLIAGPIVRYQTVEAELCNRKPDFDTGVSIFILGLSQKVLLANNMGLIWEEQRVRSFSTLSMSAAWLSIIAYAFQIYFDFCGYSNMAIGLGRMFGFHFPVNFNKPYIAKSITDFWTRWHISLSTWFKEYVYIPLGGNRNGLLQQLRNILIVWLLTGLWHGANWNFLCWGLYFALLLMLEKLGGKKILLRLPGWIQHFYSLFLILIGWVLFVFERPSDIMAFLSALFNFGIFGDSNALFIVYNNWVLFAVCILTATNMGTFFLQTVKSHLRTRNIPAMFYSAAKSTALILLLLLSIAYIVDSSYNPFLYFRF